MKCVQVVKENTEEDVEEGQCTKSGTRRPPDLQKCDTFSCEAEWFAKNFGKVSMVLP